MDLKHLYEIECSTFTGDIDNDEEIMNKLNRFIDGVDDEELLTFLIKIKRELEDEDANLRQKNAFLQAFCVKLKSMLPLDGEDMVLTLKREEKCEDILTKLEMYESGKTSPSDRERYMRTFKNWARKNHPDKGGDTELFKRVNNCIDELVRKEYDEPKPEPQKVVPSSEKIDEEIDEFNNFIEEKVLPHDDTLDYHSNGTMVFTDKAKIKERQYKHRPTGILSGKYNVADVAQNKKYTIEDTIRYIQDVEYKGQDLCRIELTSDGFAKITHTNGHTDLLEIDTMKLAVADYVHDIKLCKSVSRQQIEKYADEFVLFDEYAAEYDPSDHSLIFYTRYENKYYKKTRKVPLPQEMSKHDNQFMKHYKEFDLLRPHDFDKWISERFSTYRPQIEYIDVDQNDEYFVLVFVDGGMERFRFRENYTPFLPVQYTRYTFNYKI